MNRSQQKLEWQAIETMRLIMEGQTVVTHVSSTEEEARRLYEAVKARIREDAAAAEVPPHEQEQP